MHSTELLFVTEKDPAAQKPGSGSDSKGAEGSLFMSKDSARVPAPRLPLPSVSAPGLLDQQQHDPSLGVLPLLPEEDTPMHPNMQRSIDPSKKC